MIDKEVFGTDDKKVNDGRWSPRRKEPETLRARYVAKRIAKTKQGC